jgi:1-phosphofructokinase
MGADLVILSGPAGDDTLPADVYRRLAADVRTAERPVIVDLAGERLTASLAGGVTVAKVSDEELLADGRVRENTTDQVIAAMKRMNDEGAAAVIVTRADKPFLVLVDGVLTEVTPPKMEIADTSGAGDSLTAGVAATLASGGTIEEAVMIGAAAGALNVTRHGLGTGDLEAITAMRELVTIRTLGGEAEDAVSLSPDELAGQAQESPGEAE